MDEFYHLMVSAFSVKGNILKRDKAVGLVERTDFFISGFTVEKHEPAANLLIYRINFFRCGREYIIDMHGIFTGGKCVVFTELANKISDCLFIFIEDAG